MKPNLDQIRFSDDGLIAAVVQDAGSGEVLTLAYMNRESLEMTIETDETWFWSRSRSELWHKGATSGNTQRVVEIRQDCDSDALVIMVEPAGPACHTGKRTCFYRDLDARDTDAVLAGRSTIIGRVLEDLNSVIEDRRTERPEGSYTTYLFEKGLDKILKKVGEEATETVIAAKNDDTEALVSETADLIYHLLVLLVERGITLEQVSAELERRRFIPSAAVRDN